MLKNTKIVNRYYLLLYVLIILFVIVIAGYFFIKKTPFTKTSKSALNSTFNSYEYISEDMEMSIQIPTNLTGDEQYYAIELNDDAGNTILINRAGSQFNNVEEYYNNLAEMNQFKNTQTELLTIDGYTAIRANIPMADGKNRRIYFIQIHDVIYTFSAHDEALFDEIDHIAQSFKYLPSTK